jgi:hypothetical protein
MWNRLIDLGAPGEEILTAWIAKEELRALLTLSRTHPQRHQISARLWAFYRWCAASTAAELHRLAATIETWWPRSRRSSTPESPTPPARGSTASDRVKLRRWASCTGFRAARRAQRPGGHGAGASG